MNMDWTQRVGELRRMAHDYYDADQSVVGDYAGWGSYLYALTQYLCESEARDGEELDDDEQRVIRNELERIIIDAEMQGCS